MAIGPQESTAYLASLTRTLPDEITVPDAGQPLTRDEFLDMIRTRFLPHITCGPGYRRAVDDNLAAAIREFRRGFGEEFQIWLDRATQAAEG